VRIPSRAQPARDFTPREIADFVSDSCNQAHCE
jgi:hypothetical protein